MDRCGNVTVESSLTYEAIWGEHSDRLIISVGTGEAPGPSFVGNAFKLVDALAKLVTSCKKDDERYQRGHRDAVDNGRFYRFNVTHGLAEVGLEEWDALEQIEASTNSYLSAEAVFRSFRQCASTMHEAGQRLGYIAGAELQTHLRVQEMASVYCEFCEDCHKGWYPLQDVTHATHAAYRSALQRGNVSLLV